MAWRSWYRKAVALSFHIMLYFKITSCHRYAFNSINKQSDNGTLHCFLPTNPKLYSDILRLWTNSVIGRSNSASSGCSSSFSVSEQLLMQLWNAAVKIQRTNNLKKNFFLLAYFSSGSVPSACLPCIYANFNSSKRQKEMLGAGWRSWWWYMTAYKSKLWV